MSKFWHIKRLFGTAGAPGGEVAQRLQAYRGSTVHASELFHACNVISRGQGASRVVISAWARQLR